MTYAGSCLLPPQKALTRNSDARVRLAVTAAALAMLVVPGATMAQSAGTVQLFAGDSVRINGDRIGRVLSIDGDDLVVVSRDEPRCRAGQMHGEAPVCDPAPLRRTEMKLGSVRIEKRSEKSRINLRTVVAGVVGGAAFALAGREIGPTIGFGKIEGCLDSEDSATQLCSDNDRIDPAEYPRLQREADQRRGMIFFGAIGGTATAILVRKLSIGWVDVTTPTPASPDHGWGLSFTLPSPR